MQWRVDERVRHEARPEWGLGKVLDVWPGEKLLVQFLYVGEKLLKMAPLVKVTGAEAEWPAPARRARAATATKSRKTIAEYRKAFLDQFPEAFAGDGYVDTERTYKLDAGTRLHATLGREPFEELVREERYDEVCTRALAIVGATNLIFPNEKMALRDGLASPESQQPFSAALFELLHGSGDYQPRFEAFAAMLEAVGAAKWTIVTYFSFVADPETHLFLKPECTKRIADACAVPLNYRPSPNWLTYDCVQRLGHHLKEELADLGPRDMIDVQSFIWCVAR